VLVLVPAAEVAELTAELAELVRLSSSDVMDERTAEPVAVDSSDDRLAMAPAALLVMELTCAEAAELMELEREEVSREKEEVVAVVVVWAEARAAKAAMMAA